MAHQTGKRPAPQQRWRVGIVDPHGGATAMVRDGLTPRGVEVRRAEDWTEAGALVRTGSLNALLVVMCLPAETELDRISRLQEVGGPPVVTLSGCVATDLAARVLFPAASAYLTLPTRPGELWEHLVEAMRDPPPDGEGVVRGIVGRSSGMANVVEALVEVAPTDSTVLVTGETGTGKELVARSIHGLSKRGEAPFVVVDCAGLSEGLLESELFGHVRGSFTGAQRDRPGLFETARNGTVFLDEVADAPERLQVRLLRVLQEREVRRVGESRTRSLDVRVIAASQRDLAEEVRQGRFREDLYYRLRVFEIHLPPLRQRPEDIPLLVAHWLEAIGGGRPATQAALRALEWHDWPGNVREVRAVLEAAAIRASDSPAIGLAHLPAEIRDCWMRELRDRLNGNGDGPTEVRLLKEVLEEAGGVRQRAAALLGVSRTTLWRILNRMGL